MNYEEPLLWEKGDGNGCGYSFPNDSLEVEEPRSKHLRGQIDLPGFSEPVISRHFTVLSTWNYGVDTGIYPLGSCTMKYNPKVHEKIAAFTRFTNVHPLLSDDLTQGSLRVLYETGEFLKEITGMDDVTLQPAAGAHGELTSLMMFKKYHRSRGDHGIRDIILIPDSAHGTNPASASICGYKTVIMKSNSDGILTVEEVEKVISNRVAGIMITNPNTLGIFEKHIKEITDLIHSYGGLVYADGANLNPLLGKLKVGDTGVDAMHINLHKTFSTPHGGGGPGAGAVCVKKNLSPFLPVPRIIKKDEKYSFIKSYDKSIGRVHGFYGNFLIVLRAYCYILSMGSDGLNKVSDYAVINANYIKSRLKNYFHLPYNSSSMHEVLFTDKFQQENGVTTLDIAKRLVDNGLHPPTIYFPLVVHGAILIEPTENESLESLDNFINMLIKISNEAKANPELLLNSPTTCKRERINETLAARNPILKGL